MAAVVVSDVGVSTSTVLTVVDYLAFRRDCTVCLHNKIIIADNIRSKEMGIYQ